MKRTTVVNVADNTFYARITARNYPLSRWYVRPLAERFARRLADTFIRPTHLTWAGGCCSLAAAGLLVIAPQQHLAAAAIVLCAWFFDRADGLLARLQRTVSPRGAWLDANLDELGDVCLHFATAAAAATTSGTPLPYALLLAFISGKYLFMHGLSSEPHSTSEYRNLATSPPAPAAWIRQVYHLPANSDVRMHLLLLALATGQLTAELALVAGYYNFRWIARYALVVRRLPGVVQ